MGGYKRIITEHVGDPGRTGCEIEASGRHLRQDFRDVGILHEAIADSDLVEVLTYGLSFEALAVRNARDIFRAHGDEQVLLVKNLIVLQVMKKGAGRRAG